VASGAGPAGDGDGAGDDRRSPATGAAEATGVTSAPGERVGRGPEGRPGTEGMRRWVLALLAICALGLVIRVAYTLDHPLHDIAGDAEYYHDAANLLADGEGFVHPSYWEDGVRMPGADHPPGYQVVLAVPSLAGFDTVRDHQLFSSLLGTVTVGLVGVAGLQVAGRRTGLIAALAAAVYPNMWLNDAALMSETLALLCGVLVVIAAYAAWRRPDTVRFVWVGVTVGLAMMARAEAVLLVPLVCWPLAAWVAGLGWRARVGRAALATAVAGLVIAPWVVPNLFRFEEPTTLSTQLGPTLDVANCDPAYSGPGIGSWSFECAQESDAEVKADPAFDGVDRSVIGNHLTDKAVTYAREHADRLPAVVAARFGRAWGLYVPGSQLKFDRFAENRPMNFSQVGLAMYYVLAAASIAGVVVLRRRGVPSFPLVALVVSVAVTVVLFYGSTRFRAPAEPSLAILGAVAADALVRRLRHEPAPPGPNPPPVARGPAPPATGAASVASEPAPAATGAAPDTAAADSAARGAAPPGATPPGGTAGTAPAAPA
jgi:4-amino-4-deoxy-L-arabinose transferase-like glycosyltransferase